MIGQRLRVYPATAFLVRANPDTSLLVFRQAQYGGRKVVLEVLDDLSLAVQTVQAVLVGSYPVVGIAAHEHTGDTGRAYVIASTQFIAHIVESRRLGRMHIDTFLQQAQPRIAVAVLTDAVHLGSTQVYVPAIVRIVRHRTRPGVIDSQTQAVVAYQDAVVVAHIERRDMLQPGAVNMHGHVSVQPEHTGIGRCDIDAPFAVFADTTNHTEFIFTLKVASDVLAVIAQQSLALSHQPEAFVTVFHHTVNRLDVSQQTTYLACFPLLYGRLTGTGLFRSHAQHAMCRGTHQNVTIATL